MKSAEIKSLPAVWTKIRNKNQILKQPLILRLLQMQNNNSQIGQIVSEVIS